MMLQAFHHVATGGLTLFPSRCAKPGLTITSRWGKSGNSGRLRPEFGNRARRFNVRLAFSLNLWAAAGLSLRRYRIMSRNRARPVGVNRTCTLGLAIVQDFIGFSEHSVQVVALSLSNFSLAEGQ